MLFRSDEVIDASYQNNVNKIVTISTNLKKIEKIKDLSNNNKDVFFTVGTHPNEVLKDNNNSNYNLFTELSQNNKCVGIGECGLDIIMEKIAKLIKKTLL